jgi:DNA-binding SARP family transcriptional activator/tetratricopeptide (TPR) repeat protein
MRFLILGPLEVRGEQGAVALGGNKLRGLLAVLLLHANKPVSAERLAFALWGQDAPSGVTKTVQVTVSRLRKALGDRVVIATTSAGYCLQMQPDELDATRFEQLVEEGARALDSGRPEHAAAVLREALSLWRGPALADLAFEPFAAAEIARLEEQRLAALEARIEADLAADRHTALVGELRRLVAVNPTRERLVAQLMLALYRCGRQTDALEAYQDTRSALIADVGIEPGPRLRELQAAILRQDTALAGRDAAPSFPPTPHTASMSSLIGGEDEPIVLALPRPLRIPAGLPFVGREAELERLRECWTEVGGGKRSAVVLGGEAGIGKTRLASELAHEMHQEGALVLYGRCEEGLAVPYQPFVEALRPYARSVGVNCLCAELRDSACELRRLLPELSGLGEPIHTDPESDRFALFEAVAALIETMTREQRALLVLDDLHWAARPTLLLMRHLIRSERPLNVLLLGTYRETEVDAGHQLSQLLADLHRDVSVQLVSIRGLDEDAIASLLQASSTGVSDRAHELAQLFVTETAGNPFYIRELLAHLVESGAIVRAAQANPELTQRDVPERLRHVIRTRVARLSRDAQRTLRVAAVAGSTFSPALLATVLGEAPRLLDALDEAVAAGLLTEAGNGEHAFGHALVRQTIYSELGSARRIWLHGQLGEALETLRETRVEVEALAHHFAEAGHAEKAADYALAASRSAIARLGYEEAIAHCERGLHTLADAANTDERRRCELLLTLAQACWDAGLPDSARHACSQAAELAQSVGDATALAHAALGFCGPHRVDVATAVTQTSDDLLQRALVALGDDDSALRAQLMGRVATALAFTNDERRTSVGRQALEMARRVADKATLADVIASTHRATHGPDVLHESLAVTRELGNLADEIGDGRLRAFAHRWRLDHLLELGDIDAVQRELEALQRLAETRREPYFKWLPAVFRASYAHLSGRLEDCEMIAHEALTHRFEGYDETAAQIFGSHILFIRREQGRLPELVEALAGLAAQYPEFVHWRCALVYIYAHLSRTSQARHELRALAHSDFVDLPSNAFWLTSVSALSEAVFLLDDTRRAQPLYKLLTPYADRFVVISGLCQGSAFRPLGLLATTLSRYDDAAQHFEDALKMNAQIRSPLWITHTQHDYARMLLLRNRAGDRDKALELLTAALSTAEQLSLKALADKTRPLKLAAATAGPPPALCRPT